MFLDGLGVESLPRPATAGDFCRRFDTASILALQEAINRARLKVWQRQPEQFFTPPAIIDADASIVPTDAQTKEGMDISYNGIWGYSALVVSLANTKEPLYLGLRGANRPSVERRLNPARELVLVPLIAGMMLAGLAGFACS